MADFSKYGTVVPQNQTPQAGEGFSKYGTVVAPAAPQEPQKGLLQRSAEFAGGLAKDLTKPVVELATRPVQLAKSVYSTIKDPIAEPDLSVDVPFYGKIEAPKTKEDVLKDVGRGFQAVALAAPVSKAQTALGRIATGAGAGYAMDVGAGLEKGEKEKALIPGAGTLVGALVPGVGAAKEAFTKAGEKSAPRIVNSLIKPLKKDLSYGKNPGRAVAEEGIVANNFEDLLEKITARKSEIGQSIRKALSESKKKIDISGVLSPIDDAINSAKRAPRTNSALIQRLESLRADILGESILPSGRKVLTRKLKNVSAEQAFEVKQLVGELTKFTGNASDDTLVNKALKRIYGGVKEKLNIAVPKTVKMNEKYADLISAEIATRYRNEIVQRQNLLGLSPTTTGIGAGLITAVLSGGAAIPSILATASVPLLHKAAASPAFKTRLASYLARQSPSQLQQLLSKVPPQIKDVLQNIIAQQAAKQ